MGSEMCIRDSYMRELLLSLSTRHTSAAVPPRMFECTQKRPWRSGVRQYNNRATTLPRRLGSSRLEPRPQTRKEITEQDVDQLKRLAKQNNHGGVERKLPCYPEIFGASTAVQLWRFLLVAAHVTEDMGDDTFVHFARVPFV